MAVMMADDRSTKAEYCVEQFERFIQGVRRCDWQTAIADAEIHAAALHLCEDPDFERLLRAQWSGIAALRATSNAAATQDLLVEITPDLIQAFFYALIDYMERERASCADDITSGL